VHLFAWQRPKSCTVTNKSSPSTTHPPGTGYCFTFYNAQVQEQRKAQIERVNLQANAAPEKHTSQQEVPSLTKLSMSGLLAMLSNL
jgi:hypothetical protein